MGRGLYVHFPFCQNKCSYCDFYKVLHDSTLEKSFFNALSHETELAASELPESDRSISTIYVGGGTPSLSDPELLAGWLDRVRYLFQIESGAEFSIEINPESVNRDRLILYRMLGINRPVFGVQSFDAGLLELLDRRHDIHNSHQAVYLANVLGFDNFGVDLIYGLPGQTTKMLSSDLDQLIDLQPPHISFYELTVEEETLLAERVASGEVKMPTAETVAAMYRGGYEKMIEAGYKRYEVCSFARPGFECRHNRAYWQGREYIGLGPSAHSLISERRYHNVPDLREYVRSLEKGLRPMIEDKSGVEERMAEAIMLGLRTSNGVDSRSFERRFGRQVVDRLDLDQLKILQDSGHVVANGSGIRLSTEGMYLADEITRRLLK